MSGNIFQHSKDSSNSKILASIIDIIIILYALGYIFKYMSILLIESLVSHQYKELKGFGLKTFLLTIVLVFYTSWYQIKYIISAI